tara:strand:+ start:1314 stop:1514 length:201 start_codon:yes stop_codon:yes gene_type:complete
MGSNPIGRTTYTQCPLAQLVEQSTVNRWVASSSLAGAAISPPTPTNKEREACRITMKIFENQSGQQ